MRDDDGVAVDVRDPSVRLDLPRDLAGGGRGRHPAAHVDELAYPLVGGPRHRASEELLVLHGARQQIRKGLDQSVPEGPVGGEIVLAADKIVVDAGDRGSIWVKVGHALSLTTAGLLS